MKTLSLLDITTTAHINSHRTPNVVLQEISDAHQCPLKGLSVVKFLNIVQRIPIGRVKNISQPNTDEEWEVIGRFVNPNVEWSDRTLLKTAFDRLYLWALGDSTAATTKLPPINVDFTHGLQHPNNIHALNACVMYRICIENNIQTCRNTTYEQLYQLVRMHVRNVNYSRGVMHAMIQELSKESLLSLYTHMQKLREPTTFANDNLHNDLSQTTTFRASTQPYERFLPKTHIDAIAASALYFGFDLSYAAEPMYEYISLIYNPNNYYPSDRTMQDMLSKNPGRFYLREYFNPYIPVNYYKETDLMYAALNEGYTQRAINDETAYVLLQTAYMSNTFYHGPQPEITLPDTHIYCEEISEIDCHEVVCWGSRATGVMYAFTYRELDGLFSSKKIFNNPLDNNEPFTATSIKKLKNLCMTDRNDSGDNKRERQSLYKTIVSVEIFISSQHETLREFHNLYWNGDNNMKSQMECTICTLFNLSMFMRGWLGVMHELPIQRALVSNQSVVDMNVTRQLAYLDEDCKNLDEICKDENKGIIMDLPLLKYKHNEFTVRTQTVGELLDIVKREKIIRQTSRAYDYRATFWR